MVKTPTPLRHACFSEIDHRCAKVPAAAGKLCGVFADLWRRSRRGAHPERAHLARGMKANGLLSNFQRAVGVGSLKTGSCLSTLDSRLFLAQVVAQIPQGFLAGWSYFRVVVSRANCGRPRSTKLFRVSFIDLLQYPTSVVQYGQARRVSLILFIERKVRHMKRICCSEIKAR